MKITAILSFFTVVACGVNLCYKLGQSVEDMTDGLCWLWTQPWLCPKQGTAALLPQTKAASRKAKNSQPAFFAVLHYKAHARHQTNILLAIFTADIQATVEDSPVTLLLPLCCMCLVVWWRTAKMGENIATFHIM